MRHCLFALFSACAMASLALTTGCPCMPVIVDAGPDTSIDAGGAVALSASVLGGDGQVTYQWQPATGLNDATSRTPTATPTQTTTYTVTATSCEMSDSATVTITVTDSGAGQPTPVAGAGADQTVIDEDRNGDETVTLDGSQTDDPGDIIVSYRWFENGQLIASGVSPDVQLSLGVHTITLETTDDVQFIRTATVVISVLARPVANAGADQTVADTDLSGFESVEFDGTDSDDVDGTIVAYSWAENGIVFSIDDEPSGVVLAVGTHTITLTVTDNDGLSSSDDVSVTVGMPGAPIANAGPDQTVKDAGNDGTEAITLNGSGSTAALTITSYRWLENSQRIAAGVSPTVTLTTGVHAIALEVTDTSAQTATDDVTITVNALVAPTADAGDDRQEIDTDNDGSHGVALDASGSTDSDGQLVSFRWTEGGVELATTAAATVSLQQGMHTIDLEVTDDDGLTGTDSAVIDVIAPPPLSASAGADQFASAEVVGNAYVDAAVVLTATAAGGMEPYTYAWSEGGLDLGDTQSITPTLAIGSHVIDLTVTDATNDTVNDQVSVAIFVPSTTAGGLPERTMCGAFVGVCTGDADNLTVSVEPLTVNDSLQQVTILEREPQCRFDDQPPFFSFGTVPHKLLVTRAGADGPEPIQFSSVAFDFLSVDWSEGGVLFSNLADPVTVLGAGVHVISVSVTDNFDTETVEGIVIINPPAESVIAGATSSEYFVLGVSEVTLTATATGGTGPYAYSWTPAGALANPDAAITLLTVGANDTYTVTVTDSLGSSDTARVILALDCQD